MNQTAIITKVKSIMNELGAAESLSLISEDTLKVEDYIEKAIPDAVAWAQLHSKKPVNPKSATPTMTSSDGLYIITCPTDYARIIALKLSSWKSTVSETYPYGSEEHKQQENQYTRSTTSNPKAIEGVNASGAKVIEAYAPASSTISKFVYEANYDSTAGLNLQPNDPVALSVFYMTASLVYEYFENHTQAEQLKKTAVEFYGVAN